MRVAKQRQPSNRRPAIQLQVKTVLNAIQRFPGFVFRDIRLQRHRDGRPRCIEITVQPHPAIAAKCSRCLKPAPGYDRLEQRSWLFVPLWGLVTWFLYAARRVHCPEHGVVVEHVPWSDGKRPVTIAMMCFLSRWARRLSWRETARAFGTSWECVYRSVAWFVQWGLVRRQLEGIESIGVDEIHWGKSKRADNFLTVIYQIDRPLPGGCCGWAVAHQSHLAPGLGGFGRAGRAGIAFCVQRHVAALPDRHRGQGRPGLACAGPLSYHLAFEPGRGRSPPRRKWAAAGASPGREAQENALEPLRKGSRVRGRAKRRLYGLLQSKLATGRAWMLKETFHDFWRYRSLTWAAASSDVWTTRALRSRLEPMKKVARMLRAHEDLLMNWFKAKGEISAGAVEGLNNKIRVVTRRSYGFRTYDAMEIALYHTLGRLPEPNEFTHTFC